MDAPTRSPLPHKENLIRVFTKGGMIAPNSFIQVLKASHMLGNEHVLFGSREDILIPSASEIPHSVRAFLNDSNVDFEQGGRDAYQNIVSSAIALGITATTPWLDLIHYQQLLATFTHRPQLKINITDPRQAMVPLFTGHLNFVAAQEPHHWHLYIRGVNDKTVLEKWPALLHSSDLAKLARAIETSFPIYAARFILADLQAEIKTKVRVKSKTSDETLLLPPTLFPYYEGMNSIDENHLWLGLYWRNNKFDITFLRQACQMCMEADIPYLYISPWKSFIIKPIKQGEHLQWEKIMGQLGINMRHSSLELNWHIPVLDEEALALKRYLVSELDQQDICTQGLTFAVVSGNDTQWFTSIVIQRESGSGHGQQPRYNVYYARDFNANTTRFLLYAGQVSKTVIPALLIELSKMYYQNMA